MKRVLVTGTAGFIGYHVAQALLARGDEVVGVDNVNNYYEVSLKEARLRQLEGKAGFTFHRLSIADREAMQRFTNAGITDIVHLAAQAGVRYSLQNPFAYNDSNLTGHLVILELARHMTGLGHFVYASSSSVYGGNTKVPFSIEDPVERPVSLYAATKRANELMSQTYAHLYRFPVTGLRFFTVYGPWGRPDMAALLFARQIEAGEPIKVFNNGQMSRDFTYIDDIVDGVLATLDHPPIVLDGEVPAQLYNLGNSHPEALMDFIGMLEDALGKKAVMDFHPMQAGDVVATYADIAASTRDLGYLPKVRLKEGISRFVEWFRSYNKD